MSGQSKVNFFFDHTRWLAGSWFPNQGVRPLFLALRTGIPTTEPPGIPDQCELAVYADSCNIYI